MNIYKYTRQENESLEDLSARLGMELMTRYESLEEIVNPKTGKLQVVFFSNEDALIARDELDPEHFDIQVNEGGEFETFK